jgi:hypothetical protein
MSYPAVRIHSSTILKHLTLPYLTLPFTCRPPLPLSLSPLVISSTLRLSCILPLSQTALPLCVVWCGVFYFNSLITETVQMEENAFLYRLLFSFRIILLLHCPRSVCATIRLICHVAATSLFSSPTSPCSYSSFFYTSLVMKPP